ncbi:hypothetical protein QYE76_048415 [Lolium multiflorum]|uniref:Retrotransposon gag domain-containing protein n=1 Tax=Lolium multiflorum TaxID=4521 RepID=A0AAD8SKT5_LOLMU|nr:hypothetical protein QYE76_048415 [Lolium multiflorum]
MRCLNSLLHRRPTHEHAALPVRRRQCEPPPVRPPPPLGMPAAAARPFDGEGRPRAGEAKATPSAAKIAGESGRLQGRVGAASTLGGRRIRPPSTLENRRRIKATLNAGSRVRPERWGIVGNRGRPQSWNCGCGALHAGKRRGSSGKEAALRRDEDDTGRLLHNFPAGCCTFFSLEAELQKRFEHHDPCDMMRELKVIFETHAAVESYEASKQFFGCMMEEGSSVSEHMFAMSGHARKLSDLGIVIPNQLGIHRVLQSLPPSYKNFVMNYNMQNMNKELPELFSEIC